MNAQCNLAGKVGLGLRREIISDIIDSEELIDFVELAPENWIGVGGKLKRSLESVRERFPITAHGLSLSIGSDTPIDYDHLRQIKQFLNELEISLYSEHLSFSKCKNAHLYDLFPIPFTVEAAKHVAERISVVQDFLGRQLILENVSYYLSLDSELTEADFLNLVFESPGCGMLLDVNNVFVNSINHGYDPFVFLKKLNLDYVRYIHIAGHEQRAPDLIIDTHGQPIIEPVFDIFRWVYSTIGEVPVLLERDYNFDDFQSLSSELNYLAQLVKGNSNQNSYEENVCGG